MSGARLGFLTPSSNTALEPVTARIVAQVPGASAHFARFRVTEIGLGASAVAQFDPAPMLAAAELLADARCASLCWSGTSAGWLGLERDRELCRAIEARTGIRATTASLAIVEALRALGARGVGLVTPYADPVQQAIVANLGREGFECVAERHSNLTVNFDFAATGGEAARSLLDEVAQAAPDAAVVWCTNLDAASLAHDFEARWGLPLVDSIAAATWGALRAAAVDARVIRGFGRVFGLA